MKAKLWMLFMTLMLAVPAMAHEGGALEGEYEIGGPVGNKGIPTPGYSHLHLRLTGEAAKTLYRNIETAPKHNDCTGFKHKKAGNVDCFEMVIEESYACVFAVNLKDNGVDSSGACR